jgi:ComF family protein
MNVNSTYLGDFVSLIFPDLCQACGRNLFHQEHTICTKCLYNLPYTDFHLQQDNPVAKQFWGRVSLHSATAYLYFAKGGRVQQLMHQLKYKNRPDVGHFIGLQAGRQLLNTDLFSSVDLVVPVPLHKMKKRMRGYNQSAYFASGLSEGMSIASNGDNLIRQKFTTTQTSRSRFSRYENMQDVFLVKHPEIFKGKHILLVDDIITTGATLESCSHVLLNIPEVKVSIAAIAYTV